MRGRILARIARAELAMDIAAENLLHVLHGQVPEWIPVECLSDRRYGEGAYIFVTYSGALAPQEGGLDLWGVTWTATGETLPYPSRHPATSLEQALTMSLPDIHAPRLWAQATHKPIRLVVERSLLVVKYAHSSSVIGLWWEWRQP